MNSTWNCVRRAAPLLIAGGLLAAASAAPAFAQFGGGGPTAVGYVVVEKQDVPMTRLLPGRVDSSLEAEVRPQVGGIITEVNFTEGQSVKEGDVLYQIDSKSYEASLAQYKASLASAESQVPTAEATVERYERLVKTGGVAQTDLDAARADLAQARAEVEAAKAEVQAAQITLDEATITAPISGIVSESAFQTGSLVTASQTDALTTIRQFDPIKVTLTEPSADLLRIRNLLKSGSLKGLEDNKPQVQLTLEDGTVYDQTGEITATDFVVSETTGSFSMTAHFDNPEQVLLPGMFVRANVDLGMQSAFLIPQRAVTFNADGDAIAYFVSDDGKTADERVLTTSRSYDNSWVVTDGVSEGDKLLVDGTDDLSDGDDISPVAVTIGENGVIDQTLSGETDGDDSGSNSDASEGNNE